MTRKMMLFSLAVALLLGARLASADSYDDCLNDCRKAQTDCVEAITFADEVGIREAKQACADAFQVCKKQCHEDDAKAAQDAVDAKVKQEAEEAERKRQEEQENINGIKVLDLNKE